MKCTFVGVGSAFDAQQTSTSILLESNNSSILLDCGFNAAHSFVRLAQNPAELDSLWISHFHGDHFFGIPFLVGYFITSGRTKDFCICGPPGIESKFYETVRLAYPNILDKKCFDLVFKELYPEDSLYTSVFNIRGCDVEHSGSAMAVRIECPDSSVFYSGDGCMTPDCEELANKVDLGILEAYQLKGDVKNHSTVQKCLDFATVSEMRKVALVHMDPFVRICQKNEIESFLNKYKFLKVLLPVEGQSVDPVVPGDSSYATSED